MSEIGLAMGAIFFVLMTAVCAAMVYVCIGIPGYWLGTIAFGLLGIVDAWLAIYLAYACYDELRIRRMQ